MMVFNCKACGKPIVFITTVAGKKMPCDAMVRPTSQTRTARTPLSPRTARLCVGAS